MVAVITGSGLGLGNTSLTQLGQAQGGPAGMGQASANAYVNVATGNLVLQSDDEGLVFDGLPLNALRTYNSLGQLNGSDGWIYGFSRSLGGLAGTLNAAGSSITRTADDGSSIVYGYNAGLGEYVSTGQSGATDTLRWDSSSASWTWTDAAHHRQETYDASGRLVALADTATGASYGFSYSGNQLAQIMAGDGDTLLLDYNASNQLVGLTIQEVPPGQTTPVTRQAVSYSYDGQGRLTGVVTTLASDTDSNGTSYATTYTYDGTSDRVASVTQSDGTTVSYSYTEDAQGVYQVTGITTGTGAEAQSLTLDYGNGGTTVTDGLGNVTQYQYDASGNLVEVVAPAVDGASPVTRYTYDANGNLLTSTDPNGAVTSYQYDASGNLLSAQDGAGQAVTYTYDANDQVTSKTTYAVAAQGEPGQSGYVAPGGAQTTYYVYNARGQLAYTVDPLGHVTENDYTVGQGNLSELTSTRQYRGATYDLSDASSGSTPTLAQLQAWVASAAVQSTLSQSARIDYGYDVRGQLATKTQWDTVDANGDGVLDAGTVVTRTTYDAQGRLLQTSVATGADHGGLQTTTYAYDGLGRLVSTTDPSGNVTSYVYTDSASTLTITQANGLTTTQVRNSAGQLVSSTQSAGGQNDRVTSYLYDAVGNKVAAIDPDGYASYTFYDADGRVAGMVDANGAVTAFGYDADGRLIHTTQYATTIDTSGWISGGALTAGFPASLPTPSASSADTSSTQILDADGRVVAAIDAAGRVTVTAYDGEGNAVATTEYVTPLTAAQIASLGAAPKLAVVMADLVSSPGDRTTLTIYDADNRVAATIDPLGNVKAFSYDATGDLVGSTAYPTPLTAAQIQLLRGSQNMSTLKLLMGAATAQTIYNTGNQPVATISATGQVAVTTYDAAGDATAVVDYATPLSQGQLLALGPQPTLAQLQAVVAPGANDTTTLTIYDGSHRVVATVGTQGQVAEYTYDAAGNVTSNTVYATALTAAQVAGLGKTPDLSALQAVVKSSPTDQESFTLYDGDERQIASIDPAGMVVTTSYAPSGGVVTTTQHAVALTKAQIASFASHPALSTLQGELVGSANDRVSLAFYNDNQQEVATVDAAGRVTLNTFDTTGKLATSVAIGTPLTTAQLTALQQAPDLAALQTDLAANQGVSTSLAIYDASHRVVATVANGGVVTVNTYDAYGNVASTVQYANTLTEAQIEALGGCPTLAALQAVVVPSASDSVNVTIYDAKGNKLAVVAGNNGNGAAITTTTYDANGNPAAIVNHANLLTIQQAELLAAAPSEAALQALIVPSVADAITVTIRDANGRPVATVVPTEVPVSSGQWGYGGSVTTTSYDAAGQVQATTVYATPISTQAMATLANTPTLAQLQASVVPGPEDQTTVTIHDASGRVVAQVSPVYQPYGAYEGSVTTTTYNSAGGVVETVVHGNNLNWAQLYELGKTPTLATLQAMLTPSANDYVAALNIYNAAGQVVASLTPSWQILPSTGQWGVVGDSVTLSTYDAAGRNTSTTTFANPLTRSQVSSLGDTPSVAALQALITPSANDQVSLNYYDAGNRLVATLGINQQIHDNDTGGMAPGYVLTTHGYDATGTPTVSNVFHLLARNFNGTLGSPPSLSSALSLIGTASNFVGSTVYDANGRAVAVIDGESVTTTTYDAAGRVVSTMVYANGIGWNRSPQDQIAQFLADPTFANLASLVSASPYDHGAWTVYTANGSVEATLTLNAGNWDTSGTATLVVYDANGDVVSTSSYTHAPSPAQLTALGAAPTLAQLQALITPASTDHANLTIRDASGRTVGQVNASGIATITSYDTAGNVVTVRQYAEPLTGLQVDQLVKDPTLAALEAMVQPTAQDTFTTKIYDANEQLLGEASNNGDGVSLMTYDGAGDQTATRHYAVNLSVSELQALAQASSIATLQLDVDAAQGDSIAQTFHDAAGRPIATISPNGAVITTAYDANGHATAVTQYAIPLDPANGQVGSYTQLMSVLTPSAADSTTRTIYDSDGKPVAEIDPSGHVTVISYDAAGNAVSRVQDAMVLTPAQLHALGNAPTMANLDAWVAPTTHMVYDAAGRLVATVDPNGNASFRFYDATGRLAGTVDADGDVTAYAYDANGNVTQSTQYATRISTAGWLDTSDALGGTYPHALPVPPSTSQDRITTQVYDTVGQVVAVIDPSGNVATTSYDVFGDAVSTTRYAVPLTTVQRVALGSEPTLADLQAVISTSSNDRTSTAAYDNDGRQVASVDAAGYLTQTSYDADGHVVQQSREIGWGNFATTNDYYDGTGRLVAQIDADGYLTVDSYDAATDTTTSTRYATALASWQVAFLTGTETVDQLVGMLADSSVSEQSSKTYNADRQLVSSTAADGTVTTYQYDADGRLAGTVITPVSGQGAARTSHRTYDAFGNVVAATDANGATTTYRYDADGRQVESTDPEGNSTWYFYDPNGRLLYAVQGQPSNGASNALGNVKAYSYDAFGEVVGTVSYASPLQLDTAGPSYAGVLNPDEASPADVAAAIASLPASTDDANATTAVSYTTNGEVATATDGNGFETAYAYDAFGDRVQAQQQLSQAGQAMTAANSVTTSYAYDANGEQTEETDGVGTSAQRSTSAVYDGLGDVVGKTDGMGNTTTYQYDALGQETSSSLRVQNRTRTIQASYDAFGRVLTTTDALGNTTTYGYDLATHTATVTTPLGVTMTMVKDAYGDTVSVSDGAGNTTHYTYDGDGRLLSTTDALGHASTDAYDANGDLIRATDATGHVVAYSYDAGGRVLSVAVDPNGLDQVTTYAYDGEGRTLSVTDPMGTVATYAYDGDGNVLSQVQDAGAGRLNLTTTYTYDGAGKTLTVTQGAGTPVASTTQYTYDALERVVQKTVDPTGLALTTTYQYDANDNLIATTDTHGNVAYTIYNQANEAVYEIASANGAQSGDFTVTRNTYDADGRRVSTTAYSQFLQGMGAPQILTAANGGDAVAQNLFMGALDEWLASSWGNDATSYNVYNADGQRVYQIDPTGAVTETRYNTLGQAAETLSYALPVTITGHLRRALQRGTASMGDIQNALSIAGDDDTTARVAYNYYDADGRQVYRASLSEVDGTLAAVVSQTVYDAAGRVLVEVQHGATLPATDVGGSSTTASLAQALAQADGAVPARATQYVYDAAGNQVATIDPEGNVSYAFYDAAGRVVATVDAMGATVQYTRDALGRVVQQTAYASVAHTENWLVNGQVAVTLAQALPAANPLLDRGSLTSYDALGRVSTVTKYSQIQDSWNWVRNPDGSWTQVHHYQYTDGDTLSYAYDADSRVVQTTDVDLSQTTPTRTTRFFYDAKDDAVATLDADGVLSLSYYDAAGHLLQNTTYGAPTNPSLRANGTLAQLMPAAAPGDETTSNYYDALGNRVATLDAGGYYTSYGYDLDGRQTSVSRYAQALATNLQAAYRYAAGAPYPDATLLAMDAGQGAYQQTSASYDSYGDVVSATDVHGDVTQYSYDHAGRIEQSTVAAGTRDQRTTRNAYDAFGNLASTTDGLGNVTTYAYDLNRNRVSMTDALGNTTWYVHDADNRLVFTVRGVADASGTANALGEVSRNAYDSFGDVTSTIAFSNRIQLPRGTVPTLESVQGALAASPNWSNDRDGEVDYAYDLEGNVVSKTDGEGHIWYTYDGFNELVARGDTYDGGYGGGYGGVYATARGVSEEARPLYRGMGSTGETDYTYDGMGRMTSEVDSQLDYIPSEVAATNPGALKTHVVPGHGYGDWQTLREQDWAYDAFGNVASYTDGDRNSTHYTYDALNRQLSQGLTVSGQVRETTDTYDAYGRVIRSTDAQGLVTRYRYDDAANSVTETGPNGGKTTTVYNAEGQASAITDAQGNTTRFHYDADGRLVRTTNPDGSTVTNKYDDAGNLVETTDADGHVVAYTYDAAGRMLSRIVDPQGLRLVTSYAYDGRGLRIAEADPNGVVTTYAHDGNGNVSETIKGGSQVVATRYYYNDRNEVTSSAVSSASAGNEYSSYQYDMLGRMTGEETDTGHAAGVQYAYDADGNVVSKTDGNGNTTHYFYNEADQQTGAVAPNGAVATTTYNADGKVTSTTQYANVLSQDAMATLAGGEPVALATLTVPSADDRTSYSVYNRAGQLQYAIDARGVVTEMKYDKLGQVTETLVYATPISLTGAAVATVQGGTAAAATDVKAALAAAGDGQKNARITHVYYDDMGRVSVTLVSATINGRSGFLAQQTQYDRDGNVVAQIAYGTLVPASQLRRATSTARIDAYLSGLADKHATYSVYDAAGRKVYGIDAAGYVTETQYDGDGRVTASLQYAHAIHAKASWSQGQVATAVRAANAGSSQVHGTRNVYDSLGNLIRTEDAAGNITASYTYDARGLKLSSTDVNGNTTSYGYDAHGNLIWQSNPPVAVAGYSATGTYEGVTTESIVTRYQYDGNGHLIAEIDASNTPQARTTRYAYDANGKLIQTIRPDPGAIDAASGLLAATGSHPTTVVAYNAFGEAVASEDANGNLTFNVYDHNGRVRFAVDGDGYVTGYTYDAYGDQVGATRYATALNTGALGWSTAQPPSLAQVTAALVTSPADRIVATTYDAQGNKLSVTQPAITYTRSDGSTATGSPVTHYTYDAYGNVTSQAVLVQGTPGQANAVWATTYNYYDARGNKLMSVDPMGYVTTSAYDAFGELVSTTQWANAIGTQGLTAGGAMPADPPKGVAGKGGLDRTITYAYDDRGNRTSESVSRSYVDAQGKDMVGMDTTTYGYDGNNRLVTVTENGNTITTAYDALGRVSSVTGPQVKVLVGNWQSLLQANASLSLASDALYTTASQVVSYAYDALGNKLVQTQSSTSALAPASVSTYYQYDAAGHAVAQLTPLDGSSPDWTSDQTRLSAYDGNGNLVGQWYTLTGDDGATVRVVTANTYDAVGQQTSSITTRMGIATPDKASNTTYDAFGDVVASGDGIADNVAATFDNAGNKLTATDPKTGERHIYGYNLAGQLVSDSVPVAAAAGNGSVATRYTLDLDGRVVAEQIPSATSATGESASGLHATYDAWGNVLSSTDANGDTTTYTYNERNAVVVETEAAVAVVDLNGQSVTTTPVKRSAYDIEGNLVASIDENGDATRTSYNALGQKTAVVDGAGATTYTGYDGLGRAVASQDGNGNIHFTQVDALGRAVQAGEFITNASSTRQAVWQQAYVLDQNGDRVISYDGIGSAGLQAGNASQAVLHASYAGYDSQGRVIWSQDAAQRAASVADAHGPAAATAWTQQVPNADFSQGLTGWTEIGTGFSTGSFQDSGQNWGLSFSGSGNAGGSAQLVSNDRVPVIPGQSITANGQFVVTSDHGWGAPEIFWYDAKGNLISTSIDSTDAGGMVTAHHGVGVGFVTASAPPGAAYAAIGLSCGNYNLGAAVYGSRVWWNYVPPAGASSLGPDGSVVVWLPNGHFSQQPYNQDFEQGDTGWDKGTGWNIETASNTANGSWLAGYNGVGIASIVNQDRVPVTPGQTINASIQVSLYLASFGARAAGAVIVNWYDAQGKLIGTSEGNVVSTDHKGAWKTSSVAATAPPGAAFASIGASADANGIGSVNVDAARWDYQYIAQAPTGVVQDTYVYNRDGELVSKTTADRDTETWQYNAHGQVTTHTDLSGATYQYRYDANTGAEIGESDNWSPTAQGQKAPAYVTIPLDTPNQETLSYNADGQVASERFADGSVYSYQYDASGDLVREEDVTRDGNGKRIDTVTQTTYDSHHRISQVVETDATTGAVMLTERFGYDAAGNRREVAATSRGTTQDAWYTYDGDNRVAVNDGSLQHGQIVITAGAESSEAFYDGDGNLIRKLTVSGSGDTQSQANVYDARDELVQADYAVDVTRGGTWRGVQETVSYDAAGHALVTSQYYALGTTLGGRPPGKPGPGGYPGEPGTGGGGVDVGGELSNATVNFYDAVGRLSESQTFGRAGGWAGDAGATPPPATPDPNASSYGSLTLQSEVVYQGPNASPGYDADGDVVAYQYRDGSGRVDQYQVTYLKKDGYLQAETSGVNVSGTANVQPATDASVYDSRGDQVALEQHAEDPYGTLADTVHVFATNGNGEIIERQDGTGSAGSTLDQGSTPNKEVQHYVYVNGQQLAHMDDAGTLDVLDQVTAFSSNNDSPDSYVVQAGDTLQSIAQAEYGDATLWYVLAQANDLGSDANLALGQRLQIPTVTTHSNSATTFKPYDPSAIVGSTTPSLPSIAPPPPPSNSNCNPIAEIVVIAAIVVATVFTAGAAAVAFGAASGSLWAAGTAALAGSLGAEGVAAAAIGGFVGNAVGQLTGDAEGISHGFSFGAALEGGLTAGLTAGVGYGLSEAPGFGTTTAKIAGDAASTGRGLTTAGEYAMGAASYAANVAGAKLTDQPAHFSWAGFVASGVAQGITVGTGLPSDAQESRGVTTGNVLADMAGSALSGGLDRTLSQALGDNHVASWASIGENAVGHAAGDALGTTVDPVVTKAYQAVMQSSRQALDEATNTALQKELAATQAKLENQIESKAAALADGQLRQWADAGLAKLDAAWASTETDLQAQALGEAGLSGNGTSLGAGAFGVTGGTGSTTGTLATYPTYPVADLRADSSKYEEELANSNNYYKGVPEVSKFFLAPPADPEGLAQWNVDVGRWAHSFTPGVTVNEPTQLQTDAASVAADQQASDAVGDQLRGRYDIGNFSVGELAANTLHLLTVGGNSVKSAAYTGYDMVTDRASAEQIYSGLIGMASSRPIDTYHHAVDAMSNWMALPSDQQARSLGEAGASFLAMGGAGEGAGKLIGYAGDLAGSYRSLVNAASFDGSFLEAPQGEARVLADELSAGGTPAAGQPAMVDVASGGAIDVRPTVVVPDGVPLDQGTFDSIRGMEPGTRPDPTTYLPDTYISGQLAQFDEGGSYLVPKDILDQYGRDIVGMPDNTQFMMPKGQMDELLARTGGDVASIERELGIPEGQWQGRELARIDVSNPGELNLRMPSGNEMGANSEWLPGGKLPTGWSEGVTNRIPFGRYTESLLGQGVPDNTAGSLFRKTANTGEFAGLKVPMQMRYVDQAAADAGVGLQGVKVRIVRDPELIGRNTFGYTHPDGSIDLYPDAFTNTEQLVKTLGHERTHTMQIDIFGHPNTHGDNVMFELMQNENAAHGVEDSFWQYYQRNNSGRLEEFR